MRQSMALIVALGGLSNAIAFGEEESKCRQWASEDGVPAAKMAEYVRACSAEPTALPEFLPETPAPATTDVVPPSDGLHNTAGK